MIKDSKQWYEEWKKKNKPPRPSIQEQTKRNKGKGKLTRLTKKICKEIYFLKYQGILGIATFVFGSIFFFGLLCCGIGLFVLPVSYVISLLLTWIGLGTVAGKVVSFSLIVVGIGAYLFVILYYAEMNVNSYREQLPCTIQHAEEILKNLSGSERAHWEEKINQALTSPIHDFLEDIGDSHLFLLGFMCWRFLGLPTGSQVYYTLPHHLESKFI